MKLWQPSLIGAIAAVMPGRAVAGDDDRQETTLYAMPGTHIYSVAMKRPDGPAAAINVTIDSAKGVQIVASVETEPPRWNPPLAKAL